MCKFIGAHPAFAWREDLTVSVSEIDHEHEALFRTAGKLRDVIHGERVPASARALCAELAEAVKEHFSHEEQLMRSTRYPLVAWHRQQHAGPLAGLTKLRRCVARGDGAAAQEHLESLARSLTTHVRLSDRMLGAFLRHRPTVASVIRHGRHPPFR